MYDVFSKAGLDKIETMAAQANELGGVNGDNSIRRSRVRWLDTEYENRWIYEVLNECVCAVNVQYFKFDILGFGEQIQLSRYHSDDRGHYDWHHDMGNEIDRKISITLQISDPDSYEDGDLELFESGGPVKADRKRGSMILFPSFKMHRVTPVTKGVRHSLVCWVSGPPWR